MYTRKPKHELAWVKDSKASPRRTHGKKDSSTLIVVVNRYPQPQVRPKDVGPVFIFAGLLLAVAARWLGIW
jgi:hypothetical protein